MVRDLQEQKTLGYIGHLVRQHAPMIEAAYQNFYHDPETFYKRVEEFIGRLRLTRGY